MDDPGASGVNDEFKAFRGFRGGQAIAERERADVRCDQIGIGQFFLEPAAVTIEPNTDAPIGSLLTVSEQQGGIAGKGFVNPLVAVI